MLNKARILFCGYTEWAKDAHRELVGRGYDMRLETDKKTIWKPELYDIVILAGWSWIVPDEIVEKCYTIIVHPSDLPAYAGGSPIQNQIIDGIKETQCTLFKATSELDGGPILYKEPLNLSGNMKEIFHKLTNATVQLVLKFLINYPNITEHPQGEVCPKKRRTPAMSEIKADDFANCTAKQIYDKIRCLQDPYPNPFIVCKDGVKLYITEAKL